MNDLSITAICALLESEGNRCLGSSPVSLLQHALQTACLAERAGASAALTSACLLHDLGHLLAASAHPQSAPAGAADHDHYGAAQLSRLFGLAVTEPIRLHVHAKRYLCAAQPGYVERLSNGARLSLQRQGGALGEDEARAFVQEPYAADAIKLRAWDDLAHQPAAETPSLAYFAAVLRTCVLPKPEQALTGRRT